VADKISPISGGSGGRKCRRARMGKSTKFWRDTIRGSGGYGNHGAGPDYRGVIDLSGFIFFLWSFMRLFFDCRGLSTVATCCGGGPRRLAQVGIVTTTAGFAQRHLPALELSPGAPSVRLGIPLGATEIGNYRALSRRAAGNAFGARLDDRQASGNVTGNWRIGAVDVFQPGTSRAGIRAMAARGKVRSRHRCSIGQACRKKTILPLRGAALGIPVQRHRRAR